MVNHHTIKLNFDTPVAMAGGPNGLWVADGDSKTLNLHDPVTGQGVLAIPLHERPVDIALTSQFISVGFEDGCVVLHHPITGKELFRGSVIPGSMKLSSSDNCVWVLDQKASALIGFDSSGNRKRVQVEAIFGFISGNEGIFWITEDKIRFTKKDNAATLECDLERSDIEIGAMTICANSIWVSVTNGLQLFSAQTLKAGPLLSLPEGPVDNLICDGDSRILGGQRKVFMIDPAVDAGGINIDLPLQSPIKAMAPAGDRIWVLESASPIVHILKIT